MGDPTENIHTRVQELTVEVAVLKARFFDGEKEYERRLAVLNNAHQRADDMTKNFVTREMHDQIYVELSARIDRVAAIQQDVLKELAARKGSLTTGAAIGGAILAIVGVLVTMWHAFIQK